MKLAFIVLWCCAMVFVVVSQPRYLPSRRRNPPFHILNEDEEGNNEMAMSTMMKAMEYFGQVMQGGSSAIPGVLWQAAKEVPMIYLQSQVKNPTQNKLGLHYVEKVTGGPLSDRIQANLKANILQISFDRPALEFMDFAKGELSEMYARWSVAPAMAKKQQPKLTSGEVVDSAEWQEEDNTDRNLLLYNGMLQVGTKHEF